MTGTRISAELSRVMKKYKLQPVLEKKAQFTVDCDGNDCHVCLQPSHGIHFGVRACRACAAFFRRTVFHNRQYSCRKAGGPCDVQKGERFSCRKCRYEKCLRLGMTQENVQWNRDAHSSVEGRPQTQNQSNPKKSPSPPTTTPTSFSFPKFDTQATQINKESASVSFAQRSDVVLHEHSKNANVGKEGEALNNGHYFFEKAKLVGALTKVLLTFDPDRDYPLSWGQNTLGRMDIALRRHRRNQSPNPKLLTELTLTHKPPMFENWDQLMQRTAEWMMFCPHFKTVSLEEKMVIFKHAWMVFHRFERLQISIEVYGESCITEKLFCLSDSHSMCPTAMTVDWSGISDYDSDYINGMFGPIFKRMFSDVLVPMFDMSLQPVEVTYILCQLVFHVESYPVQAETLKTFVEFRNVLSSDLHEFYVNTLHNPNYANRLIKLMHIVHAMEEIQYERTKMVELARIFDVIKFDLCDKIFDE